ncbi:hypothetical protein [Candidatus Ichthyocystis hellenicum]|uniref:hypothetical protein n=1 Tax=Candidatus Ichthyocystis hellenicum TaxID=1561003 RepID=UPI001F5F25C8|nr:hypothetical protein [Candidatus Ichthyocystis hellenicum]
MLSIAPQSSKFYSKGETRDDKDKIVNSKLIILGPGPVHMGTRLHTINNGNRRR